MENFPILILLIIFTIPSFIMIMIHNIFIKTKSTSINFLIFHSIIILISAYGTITALIDSSLCQPSDYCELAGIHGVIFMPLLYNAIISFIHAVIKYNNYKNRKQ